MREHHLDIDFSGRTSSFSFIIRVERFMLGEISEIRFKEPRIPPDTINENTQRTDIP